ncbi:MAG: Rne/Rng family ribonuclease [Nitriliruptorales bacterium]|nr:Rne/Rng family ribonuclease [Nitriliruptorales bacterium]
MTDETTTEARTRTRRRTRSSDAGASAETADATTSSGASDAGKAPDGSDARKGTDGGGGETGNTSDNDGSGSSGGRRRRGRRGGRGRGKKKAPESAKGDDKKADDGQAGRDASATADSTGKDAPEESPGDADGDAKESKKDAATRKAIAASGTRAAARKQSRGQSGRRPGGVAEEVRRAIRDVPPRTMLAQAGDGRTQVVVLEDRTAVEHYVTSDEDVSIVGNIYLGRVQNVLPGMEAAFIDIGKGRNGVLYAGEVLFDEADLEEGDAVRIEDALRPGQAVLVQVTKDPMGTKGPRLTMHLTLAGRFVVLAPDSDVFGISRKLTDRERDRLRNIVKEAAPEGHGVIVRTAAEEIPSEDIQADIERLAAKWEKVKEAATAAKPLDVVYEEPPLVVKVIRDNFSSDFVKLIVDGDDLHAAVVEYLEGVAPDLLEKVERWDRKAKDDEDERGPVLSAWGVDEQLKKAMNRKVWLPSGGYLIIESTEAMKVIDVNTGKFTGKGDETLEEIVLKTNLEAVDELVRQLRLRDMGGIIIIDFIDMLLKSNQDQVVRRLKRELLRDRTKTRVSDVSRLGLVQMTRKNVSHGLIESFSHTCKECDGRGFIPEL